MQGRDGKKAAILEFCARDKRAICNARLSPNTTISYYDLDIYSLKTLVTRG